MVGSRDSNAEGAGEPPNCRSVSQVVRRLPRRSTLQVPPRGLPISIPAGGFQGWPRLQHPQQTFGRIGDLAYSIVERRLIGARGLAVTGDFADKLQRRRVHLRARGRRLGAAQNLDASTHSNSIVSPDADLTPGRTKMGVLRISRRTLLLAPLTCAGCARKKATGYPGYAFV